MGIMGRLVVIGLGGFIGANLRYQLSSIIPRLVGDRLPYGTLFVNFIGSLILGFVMVYSTETTGLSPQLRLFVGTGMMGALTTFSTFSFETFTMIEEASYALAGVNIAANLVLTLAAVWIGSVLARAIA